MVISRNMSSSAPKYTRGKVEQNRTLAVRAKDYKDLAACLHGVVADGHPRVQPTDAESLRAILVRVVAELLEMRIATFAGFGHLYAATTRNSLQPIFVSHAILLPADASTLCSLIAPIPLKKVTASVFPGLKLTLNPYLAKVFVIMVVAAANLDTSSLALAIIGNTVSSM